jgi:hypothetical protein
LPARIRSELEQLKKRIEMMDWMKNFEKALF